MAIANYSDVQSGEYFRCTGKRTDIAAGGSGEVSLSYRKVGSTTWIPLTNTIPAGTVMKDVIDDCEIKLDFPGTVTPVTITIY